MLIPKQATPKVSTVTVEMYRQDPMYPRIVRTVDEILKHSKFVAPVDVLVGMGHSSGNISRIGDMGEFRTSSSLSTSI